MLVENLVVAESNVLDVAEVVTQGNKKRFTKEEVNPLAVSLLARLLDFGCKIVNVRKIGADGRWEIGMYPCASSDYVGITLSGNGMYYTACVDRRGAATGYIFRTDDELNRILPLERGAFLGRFQMREKEFAATLPVEMSPKYGREL